jgi:hypothetical protein
MKKICSRGKLLNFIDKGSAGLFLLCELIVMTGCGGKDANVKSIYSIDRQALVRRHIPQLNQPDILSPFSVGNGEFAFTVDFTGLQTFPEFYATGIPLGTMAQWGWHSFPNPQNYTLDQTYEYHNTYGSSVPYAAKQHSEAGQWLRANPHRLHLGRIGFRILGFDSSLLKIEDYQDIHQEEDIWEGIIKSHFKIDGCPVFVETTCHPDIDQIAVRITSELLKSKRIGISLDFPYPALTWGKNSNCWDCPEKHSSKIVSQNSQSVTIERTLDSTQYFVNVQWEGAARFEQIDRHSFLLTIQAKNQFEFTCLFSEKLTATALPNAQKTFAAARSHWRNFWQTGGAIDLSGSKDARAVELERRIILSRYLTAIQCAGSLPPQETGLTCNSWYGKFHLEMHWWHAVHFVLWGHPDLLAKSLAWYEKILPRAKQTAKLQGYEGTRWPKMVAGDGRESPSTIGVFLIWQQPHPIYYAELLYRIRRNTAVLERYKDLVFETAKFMASYAHWDQETGRYVLGPPLIPAQEINHPDSTWNPTFELSYWAFGLKTAEKWRERLDLKRVEKWDQIIAHLSKLPVNNGLYQNAETAMNTFEDNRQRNDHPTLLGAFGMLPNDSVDLAIMNNTLAKVKQSWNWETTWGWDYPLIAITAARVGKPEIAIDALLMDVPKNTYLNNGHNYQSADLPIYLPGNGGLLTAVAMMAAGWDGAPDIPAPGFPHDGNWVVKYEGLNPLP